MNEIVKVFEGKEIMFKMVDGEVYAKANSMCDSVIGKEALIQRGILKH